jgi:hypothetical protein
MDFRSRLLHRRNCRPRQVISTDRNAETGLAEDGCRCSMILRLTTDSDLNT